MAENLFETNAWYHDQATKTQGIKFGHAVRKLAQNGEQTTDPSSGIVTWRHTLDLAKDHAKLLDDRTQSLFRPPFSHRPYHSVRFKIGATSLIGANDTDCPPEQFPNRLHIHRTVKRADKQHTTIVEYVLGPYSALSPSGLDWRIHNAEPANPYFTDLLGIDILDISSQGPFDRALELKRQEIADNPERFAPKHITTYLGVDIHEAGKLIGLATYYGQQP
jgi:hypothetical protein